MTSPGWRLDAPLSRETVLPVGGDLLVIGGLTADGASSAAVTLLDPRTGSARPWGRLAAATHDAAGAVLAGSAYLFGGGETASTAAVQRLRRNHVAARTGSLPRPRSDLVAVGIGGATYLVGGYGGTSPEPSVLKSTDGTAFTRVATMPVPVRYPAVAALGDTIWIFGGQNASGPSDVIQRIDVRTGRSRVAGRLRTGLSGASAVLLHGQVYLCGGTASTGISDAIRRFDPANGSTRIVARLPAPTSNAAAAVLGNTAYLLGGETPAVTSAVVRIQLAGPGAPTR